MPHFDFRFIRCFSPFLHFIIYFFFRLSPPRFFIFSPLRFQLSAPLPPPFAGFAEGFRRFQRIASFAEFSSLSFRHADTIITMIFISLIMPSLIIITHITPS
jgi:hypothetical protein